MRDAEGIQVLGPRCVAQFGFAAFRLDQDETKFMHKGNFWTK